MDVIHTDGGFFGFPYSIGHADFFPNGGIAVQPGCVQEEISKNRWLGILGGFSFFKSNCFHSSHALNKTTRMNPNLSTTLGYALLNFNLQHYSL